MRVSGDILVTINACMWTNVTGITWMITIIALRSTLVPDTAPACSSFAVRNAPGSKRRRFASLVAFGPDIGPYQTDKGCSEWSVLNVRADIHPLGLRACRNRAMCEGWGGTEESEHRKQWQSHWETKARTQARKCIRTLWSTPQARRDQVYPRYNGKIKGASVRASNLDRS